MRRRNGRQQVDELLGFRDSPENHSDLMIAHDLLPTILAKSESSQTIMYIKETDLRPWVRLHVEFWLLRSILLRTFGPKIFKIIHTSPKDL